jgi:UPF0042 nucleotide-binding protein
MGIDPFLLTSLSYYPIPSFRKDHVGGAELKLCGHRMSGSVNERSKTFEDIGYFCVDNRPLLISASQMSAVSGARSVTGRRCDEISESDGGIKHFGNLKRSRSARHHFRRCFRRRIARRYNETRRVHPLAQHRSLTEGVQAERRKLSEIRAMADLVIDTTDFSVHDLRRLIYENFQQPEAGDQLNITIISFGFKHGLPYNADLVFDVRFLPNPNFVPELKSLTGMRFPSSII